MTECATADDGYEAGNRELLFRNTLSFQIILLGRDFLQESASTLADHALVSPSFSKNSRRFSGRVPSISKTAQ
jgi:hypothetical protein